MEDMAMNTEPFMSGSNTTGKAVAHETEQATQNPVVPPGDQDLIGNRKLKRVLASREYSKTYRQKQVQYKAKLEAEVKVFRAQIEIMAPRKKCFDHRKTMLQVENGSLKQQLSALTGELGFKQVQYAELKQERDNLEQLYAYQQQMQQNNQSMSFPFRPA